MFSGKIRKYIKKFKNTQFKSYAIKYIFFNLIIQIKYELIGYLEKILHKPIIVENFYSKLINSSTNTTRKEKISQKNIIRKGNFISGYIPFFEGQTTPLIFNFFSINYGLRSPIKLLIALLDSNFNPITSLSLNYTLRQIKYIDIKKEFKGKIDSRTAYFFVVKMNNRIPKNHGKCKFHRNHGQLRFFGIFNDYSAFVHSLELPHPLFFITSFLRINKGAYTERMFFPKHVHRSIKTTPFSKNQLITDEGDLSSTTKTSRGFVVLKDKSNLIKSITHTGRNTRRDIKYQIDMKGIDHIVAIPPIEDIDAELFFGECCSDKSEFKVKLFLLNKDKLVDKTLTQEGIMRVNLKNSTRISDILENIKFNKFGGWISFKPLSGSHDFSYINLTYRSLSKNLFFDSVHTHSFTNNEFGRTLKFAPFPSLKTSIDNIKEIEKYKIFIAIYGHKNKKINARIRIFASKDINYEFIKLVSIPSGELSYFSISEILKNEEIFEEIKDHFICQIESEETNLNANIYINKFKNNILQSVAVDHFTGG